MAEPILVTGKRISDMELVTVVVGTEKVPTGQAGDLAITPDQIAQHVITKGDFATQEDLSQVEINLQTQIANTNLELTNQTTQTRALITAETQARILGDASLQDDIDLANTALDLVQTEVTNLETSLSVVSDELDQEKLARAAADTALANSVATKADLSAVKRGIGNLYDPSYMYGENERVLLDSGHEVISLTTGNSTNPNVSLAGWDYVNSASRVLDESGLTQQQINNRDNTFTHIALMVDAPTTGGKVFNVLSRDEPNFTLLKPYAGGGLFVWDEGSAAIPDGGTVFAHNTITNGRFIRIIDSDVHVSWFAGHGWTGEDKTTRIQQAIDFANRLENALSLCVDGKYKITSSLMIDRLTDHTKGTFVIYANGNNDGFLIETPITMFSSRLPYNPNGAPAYTKAPCSEFTVFRGIHFESTIQNEECCVFDDKFLRLTFESCTHTKIRGCKEAEYLQSIKWVDCGFRQHVGYFVQCMDAYDVRCYQHRFENSQRGFRFTGIGRGCHFDDGLYQGCLAPFVNATGFFGGSINNNYFEQNADAEILIGTGGGVSSGYNIDGNIFMLTHSLEIDPNFYPIQVGPSRGFSMNGNLSSGNLANTDGASLFEISASGNTVPSNRKVFSKDANSATEIVPLQSTTQSGAYKLNHKVSIVNSSPSTNAAVILPLLSSFLSGGTITIINNPANPLYIFPNTGERILGVGYNQSHQIGGSGTKITLVKSDSDYWLIS